MIISNNAQKVLKIFHLFAISFWMGGEFALLVLLHASTYAQSSGELFGILKSYHFVSIVVAVYLGAYGSLFTGLAYSLCTNRGFFRHKWIILKWVMTIGMIVFGSLFLGKWSTALLESASELGLNALQDSEFLRLHALHIKALIVYLALFGLSTVLSVFKPWEIRELAAQQGRLWSI